VFESLKRIKNGTRLETILRGLLPPNSKLEVETHAVTKATSLSHGTHNREFLFKLKFC